MPKSYFCAECGEEILVHIKAIPAQNRIVRLVKPHKCPDEIPKELIPKPVKDLKSKKKSNLDKVFDSFKFVKSLNDLPVPKVESKVEEDIHRETGRTVFDSALIDRRPKEDIRSSTAPGGLQDAISAKPHTEPENDLKGD